MSRIAVIGAGLSGLVAARALARAHDVSVFEKSRGVGGRMATRYAGRFEFDHGAQFFTARSARFRRFLEPWLISGAIRPWNARFVELRRDRVSKRRDWHAGWPHFVGAPRMNALCHALADGLDLRLETRVATLGDGPPWRLADAAGRPLGEYDWIVSTAPAPQTAQLLPADSPLVRFADTAGMQACYALMLGFDDAPDLPWQAARVLETDISWISVNSSKPGRSDAFTLVVHSSNAWAEAHVEDDEHAVRAHLAAELHAVAGVDAGAAAHAALQRWRYANLPTREAGPAFVDRERQLAACGDWAIRGRVEAAYRAAADMLEQLEPVLAGVTTGATD